MLLLLLDFVLFATPSPAEPPGGVWIVAHRGYKAVAPENTIAAFEAAARVGADYMEVDVRPAKDGELILMHDASVDRTTNGHGPVHLLRLADLLRLDAGGGRRVPTFRQVLEWAHRRGVLVDVDHKDGPVEEVARLIRETGMTRRVVIEGPRDRLLQFALLLPGVDTMPKVRSAAEIHDVCTTLQTTVVRLSLEQLAQLEFIAAVRGCKARISVTILGEHDTEDEMQRVIRMGAQLIETDHPDVAARVRVAGRSSR